jgi:hypothetical protein
MRANKLAQNAVERVRILVKRLMSAMLEYNELRTRDQVAEDRDSAGEQMRSCSPAVISVGTDNFWSSRSKSVDHVR